MSTLPLPTPQISRSDVSPFISSYELALAAREMILAADLPLPKYLLAPEVTVLLEYFATFKPLRHERLWPMKSDNTVRNWIGAAIVSAQRDDVTFSVNPISPKTFRDSFAVHLLMNGVPKAVLQSLLGHKKAETTEIYTKVFTLDVSQRAGVRFSMAPEDAMAMLRSAQSGTPQLPPGR